ncbi:hypothetical protein KY290_028401 [Solanum tuberosum]|uniref:NB-ARC domain containing protein n=1 Tax=Solanum tuberosum TaxID=4113 RepID=A0ABQ7UJG2_SOLTU|nr:hypothetical protein KY290_028401 [Solanum tuberosum]
MDEVNEFSIEEGLHQAVILKFSYGKPDLHELCKVIPKKLDIKAVGKPVALDKATQERTRPSTTRVNCRVFLGKVGAKNQNDATNKGTDVEKYQGDAREIINAKFQSKSNKEEHRQLVPGDNSSEGRDSKNNLGVVRDATVDRADLENKGKPIEAVRLGVGKDGVLGSPNVVVAKQDNSIAENYNNEWTLVSHKKNGVSKSSNNQILHQKYSTEVELDRSNIVIEYTQFDVLRDENIGQQERIHGTDELSTEFGSTLGKFQPVTGVLQYTLNSAQFDKDVNNLGLVPRDLNKNREHVDQQVVLTHENEFIVTEEIAGKEISPNTPIMVVSDPEKAKNDLNVSKEKQKETSASKWENLVKEEENITSPPMKFGHDHQSYWSILAKSHDPEVIVSRISPTAAYDTDLGTDISDGDDEEEMLDIFFDKVAKEGDLSPRQQRSGSNRIKKKAHGRQHSWDGKVTEDFVPRHLLIQLAKQNHMTVSTTLTRSNKSKKN